MRTLVVENTNLRGGVRLDVAYNFQVQQNQKLQSARYPWKELEDLTVDICDGPRNVESVSEDIPYVRLADLKAGNISTLKTDKLNSRENNSGFYFPDSDLYKRFRLKPGDVLLSKTSDEPRAAVVGESLSGALFSPDIYRLRFDHKIISPDWVSLFFHTRYAADIFARRSYGTRIRRLRVADLRKIRIPLPPQELMEEVEALEHEAQENSAAASAVFSSTINGLYAEINSRIQHTETRKWLSTVSRQQFSKPSSPKWFLTENSSLKERWDFSYVQHKDLCSSLLSSRSSSFQPLGEWAKVVISTRKAMDPEQEVCFVQVADLDSQYFTFGRIRRSKLKDLPDRIRVPLRAFQVLLLASGSNLGTEAHPIAIVEPELDGCLASNAFIALEFKETPIYFGLVMRHPLVLAQLRGLASGTVISFLSKKEIQNLLLPVLGVIWRQDYNDRATIAWEKRRRAIDLRQHAINKIEDFICSQLSEIRT